MIFNQSHQHVPCVQGRIRKLTAIHFRMKTHTHKPCLALYFLLFYSKVKTIINRNLSVCHLLFLRFVQGGLVQQQSNRPIKQYRVWTLKCREIHSSATWCIFFHFTLSIGEHKYVKSSRELLKDLTPLVNATDIKTETMSTKDTRPTMSSRSTYYINNLCNKWLPQYDRKKQHHW